MALVDDAPTWRLASQSVRGASHRRSGAPNQDSVRTVRVAGEDGVVLAVADGHGDARHARSELGSRFAVEEAAAVLTSWLSSTAGLSDDKVRRSVRDLPNQLVARWRAKVFEDLRRDPPPAHGGTEDEPEILYGSTLLVAAVSKRLAIFVQIGDGDILAVGRNNMVVRFARGRTDLPTHVTESLCQPDAADRFRTELVFFSSTSHPELVMLSTDGYANSFVDEQAFMKVGCDLKQNLERDGIDYVARQLETWLGQTSEIGSGDDITLALLWSPSAPDDQRLQQRRSYWPIAGSAAAALMLVIVAALVVRIWFPSAWPKVNAADWLSTLSSVVLGEPPAAQPADPAKPSGTKPERRHGGPR